MSVGIKDLEGVTSVRVSLQEGLAVVTLEPKNTLDPERIRDVVRGAGFTPKAADVRVRGRLMSDGGALRLYVTGLDREYPLVEQGDQRRSWPLSGAPSVVVSGVLRATGATGHHDDAAEVIELHDFDIEDH